MPSLGLGLRLDSMPAISGSVVVSTTIPTSTTSISIGGFVVTDYNLDLATSPVVLIKSGAEWQIFQDANGNPHPCSFFLSYTASNWAIVAQQLGEEGFGLLSLMQVTNANTEIPKTGWSNSPLVEGELIINAV